MLMLLSSNIMLNVFRISTVNTLETPAKPTQSHGNS